MRFNYKFIFKLVICFFILCLFIVLFACNPDRQVKKPVNPDKAQPKDNAVAPKEKTYKDSKFILELNGVFLDQNVSTVSHQYGNPFQVLRGDATDTLVFSVNQDTFFVADVNNQGIIKVLQLTGPSHEGASPFFNLKLGDGYEKILNVFGQPSTEVKTEHGILLTYKNRNFDLELDANNNLWSIRVFSTSDVNSIDVGDYKQYWNNFIAALKNPEKHNKILPYLIHPDINLVVFNPLTSSSYTYRLYQSLGAATSKKTSLLYKVLFGEKVNLLNEIMNNEIDVLDKKLSSGALVKIINLPTSRIISNIIFVPHYGNWKLFEITFRKTLDIKHAELVANHGNISTELWSTVKKQIEEVNYYEKFDNRHFVTRVTNVIVSDLDNDGNEEAIVHYIPRFNFSPSILIYRSSNDKILGSLREALSSGQLITSTGRKINTIAMKYGRVVQSSTKRYVTISELSKLILNKTLEANVIVEFDNFLHLENRYSTLPHYLDLTHVHLPANIKSSEFFELNFVDKIGILQKDNHKYIAISTNISIIIYKILGINDDGTLRKRVITINKPQDFLDFEASEAEASYISISGERKQLVFE